MEGELSLDAELACYRNGTYELPWVEGYDPFGTVQTTHLPCNGCGSTNGCVNWIAHSVIRKAWTPGSDGIYGTYAQISYYCTDCYPKVEAVARKNHKGHKPLKRWFGLFKK